MFDERLGIELPQLHIEWHHIPSEQQEHILARWEMIRGRIPDRIKEIEQCIMRMQEELNHEDCFQQSCRLNSQIAELASTINDLHLWYRINQDIESEDSKSHQ